jgi:heme/copper-type cytochrome/quinol oxidase subunit 4
MKRIFFPAFLERYDRYTMLHKPGRWSSRMHRVAWIVLVAAIVLMAYFLVQPNDPRTNSTVFLPTILLVVIVVVGFVFWDQWTNQKKRKIGFSEDIIKKCSFY